VYAFVYFVVKIKPEFVLSSCMEVSRKVVKTNLILQQVKVDTSKSMNFTNFDEKVDKIIKGCQRAFEKLPAGQENLRHKNFT
jgi:hypothetical protein